MSRHADFPLDFRPSYGFEQFDQLLQQLRDSIPDVGTRAEILAALQLEGRALDAQQLAGELHLDSNVASIIEQLAGFGDEGSWVHEFGTVCIARINAGSDGMCSVTTYVLATRKASEVEYSWQDENGGDGSLGVRDQPLAMVEVIAMIDTVLLAQEGFDRGDWRDAYLGDDTMVVQVSSDFYPDLARWYEAAIAEWVEAHRTEE